MSERLPFKISSALKNLIGKELITDEFVAVFELVKNAFDANAGSVKITFTKAADADAGRIIIKDDGKGMDYGDLVNKWLFVAYSAKKDGTENDDYRDKIKVNRVFAGAKGVGRFSCDRLGRKLVLSTIKNTDEQTTHQLNINWEDFEENPKKEFINVKVGYDSLPSAAHQHHGTILEISGLRDNWNRDRLLRLKRSLAKLINPNQDNDSKNFNIEIVAEDEVQRDNLQTSPRDKVNGAVSNEIFENLKIRTTSLVVEVSGDGKEIKSTLSDRGDTIYVLREKNPYPSLHDIDVHLFQLNATAKSAFKREMGIESVKYGSVFLYKNGFRVYPFGEAGEDILLIDRRKQQGYNRFLGTRDLIGRIEINGDNPELRETTSRDGGLVKTDTYNKLVTLFYEYVLVRLENYAVNIIKWGDEKIDRETGEIMQPELWPRDVKIQILELITGFIKSENVISVEYDKDFLNIIENKQDRSVEKIIKNISKIGANSKNPEIIKEAAKIGKAVKQIKSDSDRKEKENILLKEQKSQAEDNLQHAIGQNSFLKDSVKADTKELQSLLHHTEKSTYWINKFLDTLITSVEQSAPKEKIFELIDKISWENQKIFSFTKYHKSTKFNTLVDKITQDIIAFVNEYLNNVIRYYDDYDDINVEIKTPYDLQLPKNFSPIEIPIIIDNLLNNSKKAGARSVVFEWRKLTGSSVQLSVRDTGNGIPPSIIPQIFDFRFTTTRGSGLGLYHVKKVLNQLGGDIAVNPEYKNGAEFLITLKK